MPDIVADFFWCGLGAKKVESAPDVIGAMFFLIDAGVPSAGADEKNSDAGDPRGQGGVPDSGAEGWARNPMGPARFLVCEAGPDDAASVLFLAPGARTARRAIR